MSLEPLSDFNGSRHQSDTSHSKLPEGVESVGIAQDLTLESANGEPVELQDLVSEATERMSRASDAEVARTFLEPRRTQPRLAVRTDSTAETRRLSDSPIISAQPGR